MKTKILIIISFVLIIFTLFIVSCKRNVFNPSIPNRTQFIEDPIANLSIPSKDAAIKVTPYTFEGTPGRVYAHVERFFKFNGEYYIIFFRRYIYNTQAGTYAETTPGGNYHLIKIGKSMKYQEVAVNLNQDHPGLYARYTTIAQGNAYIKGSDIYVPINTADLSKGYYQSSSADLSKWTTNNTALDVAGLGLTKIEVMDTSRITVGKYTYMYNGGGLQFSINRLEDRMRQAAERYETKMVFNEADFNNLHMFDIGMDTDGDNQIDYRMNPTNYIENDTDYSWIGMQTPHQVWIMPFNDGEKDYLIRFVEYCSGMYNINTLKTERDSAKTKADTALTQALALVSNPNSSKAEIAEACYQSIRNNLEYEVRNYFIGKYESVFKTSTPTAYVVPNYALTHYVIEIVDIQ
ncbi:hypothetical protein [Brachyspira murdochii]|uniref:hypothetical protein n=1 Tax=Brachyspira murdochii TaxID=84378 RepID=UPI0012F4CBE3|nr:hypothetical protein [Brachyspira murdochii]